MVSGWGARPFPSYQTGGGRVAQRMPPIYHMIYLHLGIYNIVALFVKIKKETFSYFN